MANSHKTKGGDTIKFLRRFSSIKVDFEKEKRKTISKYQQQGLRVSISVPKFFQDKNETLKRIRVSVERYSLPELYVKMICGLFPGIKSRETPDSKPLIQHMKKVFRLNDQEHVQLMDIARMTKLPQRIVNLEIVEARNLPAKDTNGLSDPFCVIYLNTREGAQRTVVNHNTLNPEWKQYFTFKVTDLAKDVLYIEIMDYNDNDESLRDRIRKFKEIKSPSTLGILLKEIANTRSVQELIGTLRIPVSEISSETLEKWFRIKNHEDKGEIYLRMALGYNKSKETATEEFLQIVHFLLAYELEKEGALSTPFYWDEHFEMWSKYILRQFKWQGGLKPKDIVLAKWRAYTVVNAIFPLNANMLCLLMDAVLERLISNEYDARETSKFWECTTTLVNTIMTFLTEIHDVLPCPVTVLHTYHMLKTIELLNQFFHDHHHSTMGSVPLSKAVLMDRITTAIQEGADKFYLKVFSDSTQESVSSTEDPLNVALERLLKMGQIIHEDLRLGASTIQVDFKGILGIDYLGITYKVYDEEYGKIVQSIVEEYNNGLHERDSNGPEDETLDENAPAVKAGLAVFKLYLAVKNIADLAPPNYLSGNVPEHSLKLGYHHWFYHSVATWIDILRARIMKWVKASIHISEEHQPDGTSSATHGTKLSKIDQQDTKEIPISSSAVDTAHMFHEIYNFWTSLGWQEPRQSYAIVRKILEELYGYLIYYAAQLLKTLSSQVTVSNASTIEEIHAFLFKVCTGINNINYVKEQVDILAEQLNISGIIKKIKTLSSGGNSSDDFEANVDIIRTDMEEEVRNVMEKIIELCVKKVSPKYRQVLQEMSTGIIQDTLKTPQQKRISFRDIFRVVMEYMDNCLMILNENLERQVFRQVLVELWLEAINGLNHQVETLLESGKTPEVFQRFNDFTKQLFTLFWPREISVEAKIDSPCAFEMYEDLKQRLSYLGLSLEELKLRYYEKRYKRCQSSSTTKTEHGILTVRYCYIESTSTLAVEILNARNLKAYDANNSSDPYATLSLIPKEFYPTSPNFTSKYHKETLFPLFDETFKFTMTKEEMSKNGYVLITLYDYDFIGRDEYMGEVFVPLEYVKTLGSVDDLQSQPQLHLVINKPTDDDHDILEKFKERTWDKESIRFFRLEKEKIQC